MKQIKDLLILVVDDEPDLLELTDYALSSLGAKVERASNGQDAFKILIEKPIDLVISDIRMPKGGGLELLDKIENLEKGKKPIPNFMFLSGFGDVTLEDAYNKGAIAVLGKPYNNKDLFAAIQNSLIPLKDRWKPYNEQDKVPSRIKLSFEDLAGATETHQLNIGRGGFFCAINGDLPQVSSLVDFDIQFTKGGFKTLRGRGIVRWNRKSSKATLPKGAGIEFMFLKEDSLTKIIAMIEKQSISAFIPKN